MTDENMDARPVIDHADIVVTHGCNMHCPHCIDPLVQESNKDNCKVVSLEKVAEFMELIWFQTYGCRDVLLLGGEPTTAGADYLKNIARVIHSYGFKVTMSTNGHLEGTIRDALSGSAHIDCAQITIPNSREGVRKHVDKWWDIRDKVNLKVAGDHGFTMSSYEWFKEQSRGFYRRSVSMYFTPDWQELCKDEELWKHLNTLKWERNGSYMYAMDEGVRVKKCIPGETNVIDEPTVPKLYPNGNYNKTWTNEDLDNYLGAYNWENGKILESYKPNLMPWGKPMKIDKKTKKMIDELIEYVIEDNSRDWHDIHTNLMDMSTRLYNDDPTIGAMKIGYALSDAYFLSGQQWDKAKEMACRARELLNKLESE